MHSLNPVLKKAGIYKSTFWVGTLVIISCGYKNVSNTFKEIWYQTVLYSQENCLAKNMVGP